MTARTRSRDSRHAVSGMPTMRYPGSPSADVDLDGDRLPLAPRRVADGMDASTVPSTNLSSTERHQALDR